MRSLVVLCALLAAASPAALAAEGANRLDMFVGTWHSTGTMLMPGSQKPSPVRGTNACRWSSEAHVFVTCDGVATVGSSKSADHQLSVYTYDAPSKQYGFVSVTTAHMSSPDLALNGNTWTYSGKFTDPSGRTTYFRTLNIFDSPKRYRYIVESSSDNAHWTQTGSGISTRTAP